MTGPAPTISAELKGLLRQVKLGKILETLPERLALARTRQLSHAEFLEIVLADEVTRRDTHSAALRARTAGLDPSMRLDHWDDTAAVAYDRTVLDELVSLRFIDNAHNALILGPVGVGKTFLATALGHAAIRRRRTVWFERTDQLLKRLRTSRLDNSHDVEVRKLLRVDLLILDDFALQPLDHNDTSDIYLERNPVPLATAALLVAVLLGSCSVDGPSSVQTPQDPTQTGPDHAPTHPGVAESDRSTPPPSLGPGECSPGQSGPPPPPLGGTAPPAPPGTHC